MKTKSKFEEKLISLRDDLHAAPMEVVADEKNISGAAEVKIDPEKVSSLQDAAAQGVPTVSMGISQFLTEESLIRLNANYKFVTLIYTNNAYGWEEEFVTMWDFKAEQFNYVVHEVIAEDRHLSEGCKFGIFLFIHDDKNTRRRIEKMMRKRKYTITWYVYNYEPVEE